MGLNARLKRLERAQVKTNTGCALYDSEGNEVEAEIITMPEHEVEGLAELEDGTQFPVMYDAYSIRLRLPEEPPLDENKLYYTNSIILLCIADRSGKILLASSYAFRSPPS